MWLDVLLRVWVDCAVECPGGGLGCFRWAITPTTTWWERTPPRAWFVVLDVHEPGVRPLTRLWDLRRMWRGGGRVVGVCEHVSLTRRSCWSPCGVHTYIRTPTGLQQDCGRTLSGLQVDSTRSHHQRATFESMSSPPPVHLQSSPHRDSNRRILMIFESS